MSSGGNFGDIRVNAPDRPEQPREQRDTDTMSMQEQEVRRFGEDTELRRKLAKWMMVLVSCWLAAVIVVMLLSGWLRISDAVLMTLLATTTFNVLGLSKIILGGLFGNGGRRQRRH